MTATLPLCSTWAREGLSCIHIILYYIIVPSCVLPRDLKKKAEERQENMKKDAEEAAGG